MNAPLLLNYHHSGEDGGRCDVDGVVGGDSELPGESRALFRAQSVFPGLPWFLSWLVILPAWLVRGFLVRL